MDADSFFISNILLGLTGLYFTAISIIKHIKLTNLQNNGITTDALIISVKTSSRFVDDGEPDGGQTYETTYYPIVEYQDEKGREVVCELKDNTSLRKSKFKIGKTIEIVYDSKLPNKASTQDGLDNNWVNLITLFSGFCMLFYSLLNLFGHLFL